MDFIIVNNIECTFRKYKNMEMAIWHITTHFMVEGHKYLIDSCRFTISIDMHMLSKTSCGSMGTEIIVFLCS